MVFTLHHGQTLTSHCAEPDWVQAFSANMKKVLTLKLLSENKVSLAEFDKTQANVPQASKEDTFVQGGIIGDRKASKGR